MRVLKILIAGFCFVSIFAAGSMSAYCLYQDNVDFEEIKEEVEQKRWEAKQELEEYNEEQELREQERTKTEKVVEKVAKKKEIVYKSKKGITFLLLALALIIAGLFFVKLRRK